MQMLVIASTTRMRSARLEQPTEFVPDGQIADSLSSPLAKNISVHF
jgi:hypothetical protein